MLLSNLSKLFPSTPLRKEHKELEARLEKLEKRFEQSRLWEKIHEIKESRVKTQTEQPPKAEKTPKKSAAPKTKAAPKKAATPKATPQQQLPPLQSLKGIGPAFAKKLQTFGVKDLAALAQLSDAAVEDLDKKIKGFKAREERNHWRKAAAQQL